VHSQDCVVFTSMSSYFTVRKEDNLLFVLGHQAVLHWVLMRFNFTHSQRCGSQAMLHWVLMRFNFTHSQRCGSPVRHKKIVEIIGNVTVSCGNTYYFSPQVTFMTCVWQARGSNLGRTIDYLEGFLSSSVECRNVTLN
jgi:hypothetical protein